MFFYLFFVICNPIIAGYLLSGGELDLPKLALVTTSTLTAVVLILWPPSVAQQESAQ